MFRHAADIPPLDSACHAGADLFRRLGRDRDHLTTDWGKVVQGRARRDAVEAGGWSAVVTNIPGAEGLMPARHALRRSNGTNAWSGWPDCPGVERGIKAWFDAPDAQARARPGRDIHAAAFQDPPRCPLGGFRQPYASRRDIIGMVRSAIPVLWKVRKA